MTRRQKEIIEWLAVDPERYLYWAPSESAYRGAGRGVALGGRLGRISHRTVEQMTQAGFLEAHEKSLQRTEYRLPEGRP